MKLKLKEKGLLIRWMEQDNLSLRNLALKAGKFSHSFFLKLFDRSEEPSDDNEILPIEAEFDRLPFK